VEQYVEFAKRRLLGVHLNPVQELKMASILIREGKEYTC
jgi:hypothetical protein